MVFWPKKEIIPEYESAADTEWRLRNAQTARKAAMRKFMYEFIRVSGGKNISILDLIKLCCNFNEDSCAFGREVDELMNNYKKLNIEPRYVHERQEFGFQQYLKYVPFSCMIQDLEFAFVGQLRLNIAQTDRDRDDVKLVTFPINKDWAMRSIYDQREYPEGYVWPQKLKVPNDPSEEEKRVMREKEGKRIDRADIRRTWQLKDVLR